MGSRRGAVPFIIYRTGGTHVKEMKGVATPEAFFLLAFLSLFVSCNMRLPLQL